MASATQYNNDYPTPPPSSSPKYKDDFYHGRPAQETYFQQTSFRPASPNHWDNQPTISPYPNSQVVTQPYEYLPARRSESPQQTQVRLQSQHSQEYNGSNSNYYARPASPLLQKIRPQQIPPRQHSISPPKSRHSPRPIYYSPTNPIPTPYNSSRPTPRPAFVQRMLAKLSSWIRSWFKWCKRNPITAGVLTFIPVLAGAGLVRTANTLGIGKGIGKMFKSMGAGQTKKEEGAREWDWGMDQFAGFGGSKGGPLEGILKILQMGV